MDAFQACWASPCHTTGSYRIAPLQLSDFSHRNCGVFDLMENIYFPNSKLLRQKKDGRCLSMINIHTYVRIDTVWWDVAVE